MPFITKEKIDQYFQLQQEIQEAASRAVLEYASVMGKNLEHTNTRHANFDDECCWFKDKWCEENAISFPLEILYSHSAMDRARAAKLAEDERRRIVEAQQPEAGAAYERREYERLKNLCSNETTGKLPELPTGVDVDMED